VVTGGFPLGVHTFVVREVSETRRAGHEVLVLANGDGDEAGERLDGGDDDRKMSVIRRAWTRQPLLMADFRRFSPSVGRAADVPRYGRRLGERRKSFFASLLGDRRVRSVELVHAHFVGWGFEVAMPLARLLGVPFTVTAHNAYLERLPVDVLAALQAQAATIILVSRDWRDRWASATGSDERLVVVHNAVDLPALPDPGDVAVGQPLTIVSVGRLTTQKRYPDALEAVARLVREGADLRYRIIGGGKAQQDLAYRAEALGLGPRVEMMGARPHSEVHDALRDADVYLHTSENESFGVAVAEAMAVGLPVVVTDSGGVTDFVEHGRSGLVVPVGDIAAITDALGTLATDGDLRRDFGAHGRRHVAEHLSWDGHMARMDAIWRAALAGEAVH
jgi:glycosyltransferase involved in cell wall biosynthesis